MAEGECCIAEQHIIDAEEYVGRIGEHPAIGSYFHPIGIGSGNADGGIGGTRAPQITASSLGHRENDGLAGAYNRIVQYIQIREFSYQHIFEKHVDIRCRIFLQKVKDRCFIVFIEIADGNPLLPAFGNVNTRNKCPTNRVRVECSRHRIDLRRQAKQTRQGAVFRNVHADAIAGPVVEREIGFGGRRNIELHIIATARNHGLGQLRLHIFAVVACIEVTPETQIGISCAGWLIDIKDAGGYADSLTDITCVHIVGRTIRRSELIVHVRICEYIYCRIKCGTGTIIFETRIGREVYLSCYRTRQEC